MNAGKGLQILVVGGLLLSGAKSWVSAGTYTTTFGGSDENPISEGGQWINGKTIGLDWSDCAIANHRAYGAQTTENPDGNPFNDSIAVLTGSWGPNQTVSGVVSFDRSGSLNNSYLEIELRLNSSISAHSCTGYEIDYSANIPPLRTGYIYIVRWNGPFADFIGLGPGTNGAAVNLYSGDIISASISNGTIRAYINGTNFLTATDNNPFTNGSPGIGFDMAGDHSQRMNYGFTSFTATDAASSDVRPSIASQPASQTTLPRSNATFQVSAAGSPPLSYQWWFRGSPLAGATSSGLTLTNVQAAQAGGYSVVVTNAAGAITSAVATLTVLVPPTISTMLVSGGGTVAFTLESVQGLNYLMEYRDALDTAPWTALPPAVPGNGGVLTLRETNATSASRYYRVRTY